MQQQDTTRALAGGTSSSSESEEQPGGSAAHMVAQHQHTFHFESSYDANKLCTIDQSARLGMMSHIDELIAERDTGRCRRLVNTLMHAFVVSLPPVQALWPTPVSLLVRRESMAQVESRRAANDKIGKTDVTVQHQGPVHYTGDWHFDNEDPLPEIEFKPSEIMFSAILWKDETLSLGTEMYIGNEVKSSWDKASMVFVPVGDDEEQSFLPTSLEGKTQTSANGQIVPVSYMYHRGPVGLQLPKDDFRYTIQVGIELGNPICTVVGSGTEGTAIMLHKLKF